MKHNPLIDTNPFFALGSAVGAVGFLAYLLYSKMQSNKAATTPAPIYIPSAPAVVPTTVSPILTAPVSLSPIVHAPPSPITPAPLTTGLANGYSWRNQSSGAPTPGAGLPISAEIYAIADPPTPGGTGMAIRGTVTDAGNGGSQAPCPPGAMCPDVMLGPTGRTTFTTTTSFAVAGLVAGVSITLPWFYVAPWPPPVLPNEGA